MDTSTINILDLIPQRPPFVLIDRLMEFTMERSVTDFTVREENPLVREGRLSEAGIMENIAQSCAARIGYISVYIQKGAVCLGIIGSVKDLQIEYLPTVGSRLETTVEVVSEVFSITLVNATVRCGERIVATCQMKISLTDKPSQN